MAYKEMLKLVLVMVIEMDKLACTNMQLELQGSQPSCISARNRWIVSVRDRRGRPTYLGYGQLGISSAGKNWGDGLRSKKK